MNQPAGSTIVDHIGELVTHGEHGVLHDAALVLEGDLIAWVGPSAEAPPTDRRVDVELLPGVEFSTRQPWPDARRLLDAGVTVALASDCNPGSSFTSSVPFCIALTVREMGMTPAEALWAATAGGARALDRSDVGVLPVGARADFAVLDAPSHVHLSYRPGVPLVAQTWVGGQVVHDAGLTRR